MNRKRLALLLIIFFALGGIFIFMLNFQSIKDAIVAQRYIPTAEMQDIEQNLALTEKGATILHASSPEIVSKNSINSNCGIMENAVILGCYYDSRIFINQEDSTGYDGLAETTTAHELLHAIWFRLQPSEQDNLTAELRNVFEDTPRDFQETVAAYNEDEFNEELYVRSAIQLKELPDELENHYSQYFQNRQIIYNFYEESKLYEKHQGKLIY